MPISIMCSHCDWKGKVKDEMAGKTGKCPTCGEHIPIPRAAAKAAPPPMPAKKPRRPAEDDPDIVEDEPKRKAKSKLSRDSDEDDRPRKPNRRTDEDDDEPRPRKKISRAVDDDEDEPRPKKKKPARSDDDDEPPPRKKKRKKAKPPESMSGKKVSAIAFGLLAVLVAGGWLAWMFMGDGRFRFYPFILLLIGLIGMFQGFTGVGLGDSDDDDE